MPAVAGGQRKFKGVIAAHALGQDHGLIQRAIFGEDKVRAEDDVAPRIPQPQFSRPSLWQIESTGGALAGDGFEMHGFTWAIHRAIRKQKSLDALGRIAAPGDSNAKPRGIDRVVIEPRGVEVGACLSENPDGIAAQRQGDETVGSGEFFRQRFGVIGQQMEPRARNRVSRAKRESTDGDFFAADLPREAEVRHLHEGLRSLRGAAG